MSDPEHSHERHDHGPGCGGHDDTGPIAGSDPGGKSLADALRVSFVLLAIIMAFMVVGFLLTGLQSIESNEVGIVKVFGDVVRTARPGLTYNWPFPIGEIEIVKKDEQRITIRDFWINEPPGEAEKPLSQRRSKSDGLSPGWDGALLTGDRYLLHMRIDCRYAIEDAPAFRRWVRDKYSERLPGSEQPRQVDPKEEMVRSAVCSAAIIAAASGTADGLQATSRTKFARTVEQLANKTLGGATGANDATGLKIRRIVLAETTWPLRARADYQAVLGARHNAKERTDQAAGKAEGILRDAAGQAYMKLVGKPWGSPDEDGETRKKNTPYDLIGEYSKLRSEAHLAADPDQAGRLEAQAQKVLLSIDEVLLSHDLGGQASKLISDAWAQAKETGERVKARLEQYERLWPEYERSPELTIARLWAAVREQVLAAAAEKYYISTGKGKTVIRINRDPKIVADQARDKLVADREAREEKKKKESEH